MKKILTIDDQQSNLISLKDIININLPNCTVLTALSGNEGIKLAKIEQPDTILLDIVMPEMDGYEVCKKLKADELTKHIPIIIITASRPDNDGRIKSLDSGADAFLLKPVDSIELTAQIKTMLRIKNSEDKLRAEKSILEEEINKRTIELNESEKKFEDLADMLPEAIFEMNVYANLTYVNQQALKLFGFTKQDIIKDLNGLEFISKEDQNRAKENFASRFKGKNPDVFEYNAIRKDGLVFPILFRANSIIKDGQFSGIRAVITDLTAQKKREKELLKNDKLLNLTGKIAKVGGWELDIQTQTLTWTKETYQIHEVTSKYQPILKKGINFYTKESKPIITKAVNDCIKKGKPFNLDLEILTAKGNRKVVNSIGQVQKDSKGKLTHVIGTFQDITKSKHIEEELRKSESIRAKMVNNIGDVIVIIDKGGINRYKSSNIEKWFGWKPEELVGKSTWENIHPEDIEETQSFLESLAKRDNDIGTTECRYLNKKGKYIWIQVTLVNLFNDPDINGFLGNYHDISERKANELNLKEALVKATESDRIKSAFLATMSHELRTPLNAIIGFSDIINENVPIDDIMKYSKIINTSGNHLQKIVEDLFDITLIEAGEVNLSMENVNLNELLHEVQLVISIEQQKLKKNHIDLNLLIPDKYDDLVLKTDASKLKQIIINLLKNALKFTHTGQIQYGYDVEIKEKNRCIRFFVEDSGIGIPKDKHEVVFKAFGQVEDTHTRKYGGTGLGLSLSKKLVEILGGKIFLKSKEGKGSTFYFTIPAEIEDEIQINKDLNKASKIKNELCGKKILIAEDDEASYEYLNTIIGGDDLTVLWAQDGKEAVKYCTEDSTIDLILMDINMPLMNGYEATKIIKKQYPSLPIIAQTAYAIAGDYEKAIEAGCDDYISKPINKELLFEKISKMIG